MSVKRTVYSVYLVDKCLSDLKNAVGISFVDLPGLRRPYLIDGNVVHQWLHVLEEPNEILDEILRLLWRRIVEATNPLLEQHRSYSFTRAHISLHIGVYEKYP